jgi:hypothetical protein
MMGGRGRIGARITINYGTDQTAGQIWACDELAHCPHELARFLEHVSASDELSFAYL